MSAINTRQSLDLQLKELLADIKPGILCNALVVAWPKIARPTTAERPRQQTLSV